MSAEPILEEAAAGQAASSLAPPGSPFALPRTPIAPPGALFAQPGTPIAPPVWRAGTPPNLHFPLGL